MTTANYISAIVIQSVLLAALWWAISTIVRVRRVVDDLRRRVRTLEVVAIDPVAGRKISQGEISERADVS